MLLHNRGFLICFLAQVVPPRFEIYSLVELNQLKVLIELEGLELLWNYSSPFRLEIRPLNHSVSFTLGQLGIFSLCLFLRASWRVSIQSGFRLLGLKLRLGLFNIEFSIHILRHLLREGPLIVIHGSERTDRARGYRFIINVISTRALVFSHFLKDFFVVSYLL